MLRQAHRSLDDVAEAFQREWTLLEAERERLSDWQGRLESATQAQASRIALDRAALDQDRECYRKDLKKVFDRELAVSTREKSVEKREARNAEEEVRLRGAQASLATREKSTALRE